MVHNGTLCTYINYNLKKVNKIYKIIDIDNVIIIPLIMDKIIICLARGNKSLTGGMKMKINDKVKHYLENDKDKHVEKNVEYQYDVCHSNLIKKLKEKNVYDEEIKKLIDELLQEKEWLDAIIIKHKINKFIIKIFD